MTHRDQGQEPGRSRVDGSTTRDNRVVEARMACLVVAAVREELGDLEGEALGVGPIAAGVRAAALIERIQPSFVALIGTAGSYPGGPPIGTAIVASRLGWADGGSAMELGYVPRPPEPIRCDPALLGGPPLERHPVLTVPAITTSVRLAERFGELGWTVEHLEAFAVGLACRQAGIPFVVVLGISNRVGPEAHAQWLLHRDSAQQAARLAIAPLLG